MAVVVTAVSGYDLGYVWKSQGARPEPERSAGGYYINAAQAGRAAGPVVGAGCRGARLRRRPGGGARAV